MPSGRTPGGPRQGGWRPEPAGRSAARAGGAVCGPSRRAAARRGALRPEPAGRSAARAGGAVCGPSRRGGLRPEPAGRSAARAGGRRLERRRSARAGGAAAARAGGAVCGPSRRGGLRPEPAGRRVATGGGLWRPDPRGSRRPEPAGRERGPWLIGACARGAHRRRHPAVDEVRIRGSCRSRRGSTRGCRERAPLGSMRPCFDCAVAPAADRGRPMTLRSSGMRPTLNCRTSRVVRPG